MVSIIDIVLITVYLLGLLTMGYWLGRKNKTQEDFLLAGRSMPWLPISLSMAATMLSANSFVGGPGWAYRDGLAPFMVNITVPLAVFCAVSVTAPIFYHMRVTSIYEYMGNRLGPLSRGLALLQFFINSLIQVSSMVFIPSLILQKIMGWELSAIVPVIVLLAITYTVLGGIKAVIWADVVQMIVVWGSLLVIIIVALQKKELSLFSSLNQAREAGLTQALDFKFSLTKTNTFWASLIGGTFLWVRYFCFDQVQVQRLLTAKSMRGIKSSLVTGALVMNLVYLLMLVVGLLLWTFYGGRPFVSSNEIMINFILQNLPVGIAGLSIAGALAAALSSVDSLLNSMTTVFIKDLYEKSPGSPKEGETPLKVSMGIAALFGLLTILFVMIGFKGSVRSILDLVGSYISYFSGPACGIFLLAMFVPRSNDQGVALGAILGFICTYAVARVVETSWLWNPAIGTLSTLLLGTLLSFLWPRAGESREAFTARGIAKQIRAAGSIEEEGVSILPFSLDRFSLGVLMFFFLQYLLLWVVS